MPEEGFEPTWKLIGGLQNHCNRPDYAIQALVVEGRLVYNHYLPTQDLRGFLILNKKAPEGAFVLNTSLARLRLYLTSEDL